MMSSETLTEACIKPTLKMESLDAYAGWWVQRMRLDLGRDRVTYLIQRKYKKPEVVYYIHDLKRDIELSFTECDLLEISSRPSLPYVGPDFPPVLYDTLASNLNGLGEVLFDTENHHVTLFLLYRGRPILTGPDIAGGVLILHAAQTLSEILNTDYLDQIGAHKLV